jgi:hypothetical protein
VVLADGESVHAATVRVTSLSSRALFPPTRVLFTPNKRHESGHSEQSAASGGTEHSLWCDPDLEEKL